MRMKPFRVNAVLILLIAGVVGSPRCLAQEQPAKPDQPSTAPPRKDPQSDPGLSDPSLEDEITGHRKAGPPAKPIPPTPPKPAQRAVPSIQPPVMDAPGLSGTDFSLPVKRFYPEGTLLPARQGQVVRARTGDLIFVPTAMGKGPAEPAMVLMGSQKLSQLEAAAAAPGFEGGVTLSGQVFVYRDRHYLLPTVFSVRSAGAGDADGPEAQAAPRAPTHGKQSDTRAEDLIKELESQRGAPRTLGPGGQGAGGGSGDKGWAGGDARGNGAGDAAGPAGAAARGGRAVRVAFDNDANSPAPAPMMLLPCGSCNSWRFWRRRAARMWCTRSAGV